MKIGNVTIEFPFGLAPMAGFSDFAYRTICAEQGCGYTVSEMVSSRALVFQDKKSLALLKSGKTEHPFAIQLFGNQPEIMAEAALKAREYATPDIIDLNMGCPTPKIVGSGDGCALMRDPRLAERIIKAVKSAAGLPVTVKFRKGFDCDTAVSFAQMCEQAGADALCVHGRTRSQMYAGRADRQCMAAVKSAVRIPVFANGDIASPDDFFDVLNETGCDGALAGRGALGNPYLFAAARARYLNQPIPPPPGLAEKLSLLARQIELAVADKGESLALLEARKQASFYFKGVRGAAGIREQLNRMETLCDLQHLIQETLQSE